MASPLKSGVYTISNHGSGLYVGRNVLVELKKSENKQAVISLPAGLHAQQWIVEASGDDYIIRIGGDKTTAIDNKLFTIQQTETPRKWEIKASEKAGFFTIGASNSEFWFVTDNVCGTQVNVGLAASDLEEKYLLWELSSVSPEESSPPLETGDYFIFQESLFLGLDVSLDLKHIITLPRDSKYLVVRQRLFFCILSRSLNTSVLGVESQKDSDGFYTLSIGGFSIGVVDNKLSLIETDPNKQNTPSLWKIEPGNPGNYKVSIKESGEWSLASKKLHSTVDVSSSSEVSEGEKQFSFTKLTPELPDGKYIIRNKSNLTLFAGRDKSTASDAKNVPVVLTSMDDPLIWDVTRVSGTLNIYTLITGNSSAIVDNDKVYTSLDTKTEWRIDRMLGKDKHRISSADGSAWTYNQDLQDGRSPIHVSSFENWLPLPLTALWRFDPYVDESK